MSIELNFTHLNSYRLYEDLLMCRAPLSASNDSVHLLPPVIGNKVRIWKVPVMHVCVVVLKEEQYLIIGNI